MLEGLEELDSKKIVHRDIKCANIFLSKNGSVNLRGLNVIKIVKEGLLMS